MTDTVSYFWIAQAVFDIALFAVACWWGWRQLTQPSVRELGDRVTACLNVVEARIRLQEDQWTEFRDQAQIEIKRLNELCVQASEILSRGQQVSGTDTPSTEEIELRSLSTRVAFEVDDSTIPSVAELEKASARLSNEPSPNLRALLNHDLL